MPGSRKILLLGAGGHCRSVLDSLLSVSCYDEIGLVDSKKELLLSEGVEDILSGYPFLGDDSDLEHLLAEGYTDAFVTIGSIGDSSVRKKMFGLLKQIGFHIPNIIDKSSVISPYAGLGEGVFVGKNAVVNANARIGNYAIINTAAVIEHDCTIGEFVHVSPGSILCGNVAVGDGAHIGAGSIIRQGIRIGEGCMIGAGSVVVKDIKDYVTAYGNPCREVRHE